MLLGAGGLPYVLGRVEPAPRIPAVYPADDWAQVLGQGGAPLMRAVRMLSGVDQEVWGVKAGASVSVKAGSAPRRSFSGGLIPPEGVTVAQVRDALSPWVGTEMRVEVGALHPRTGETRWWAAAVIVPDEVAVQDGGRGASVDVSGPDRSIIARGRKLTAGMAVASDTTTEAAVAQVLAGRLPAWVSTSLTPTGLTTPGSYIGAPGTDPWAKAEDLAHAAGCELYLDRSGMLRLRGLTAVEVTSPTAMWAVPDSAALISLTDRLAWTGGADGVIVPWGDGLFEVVPDAARSRYVVRDGDASLIRTQSQAVSAGEAELARVGRGARTVSGTVVTDPTLDVDDVVAIDHPGTGTRVVARLTQITLTAGSPVMAWTAADTAWTEGE